MDDLKRCLLLGWTLMTGRPEDVASRIVSRAMEPGRQPSIVGHVNLNNYFHLHRRRDLDEALPGAATLLLDGIGMQVAASIVGHGWLPNLNGTDLFPLVAEEACNRQVSMYLLGSESRVVLEAAERTRSCYPGLAIVGHESGYFGVDDEPGIVERVNRSGARILLIGLGTPRQEEFALRQFEHLNVGVIWAVGGLFDFLSGAKPRAPKLMRWLRLEWLYRLVREPGRMWHRNLVVPPWFFAHLFFSSSRAGSAPGSPPHVVARPPYPAPRDYGPRGRVRS